MRRALILIFFSSLIVCGASAQSAERDSTLIRKVSKVVRNTGRSVRRHFREANATDESYIAPNTHDFTVMLENSSWFEHCRLRGKTGRPGSGDYQQIGFAPRPSFKLGLYFGWKWIFLGYSVDVGDLGSRRHNKVKKTDIQFSLYTSQVGLDLYYRKTGNNFRIRSVGGFDLPHSVRSSCLKPFDGLRSCLKGFNAYYIFNHHKFSYPAIYSQSTRQLKSAGSVMAGLSYSRQKFSFDYSRLPLPLRGKLCDAMKLSMVRYSDYNVSLGYGYNWALKHNWALNASLLPAIGYKKSKVYAGDWELSSQTSRWVDDIDFDLVTRFGIVWNNDKTYFGVNFVSHTYDYSKERFSLTDTFASLKVYVGFNFWKRSKYRE